MRWLHNRIDKRILKQQLHANQQQERITLSFYKYHKIPHPTEFRNQLFASWGEMGILGRVYVASEGINAQVSIPRDQFENFKTSLSETGFLKDVRLNTAIEDNAIDPRTGCRR